MESCGKERGQRVEKGLTHETVMIVLLINMEQYRAEMGHWYVIYGSEAKLT